MISILLEVKSDKSYHYGFYNPAPSEYRKFPRTEQGIQKAIKELHKVTEQNQSWITDHRYVIYEGKYESYKDIKPSFIIDKDGNVLQ